MVGYNGAHCFNISASVVMVTYAVDGGGTGLKVVGDVNTEV
jgi:hypothetical protein